MGVGPKSLQLLAVGVIRVGVASEAVEVPQLHLPCLFFGSLLFIKLQRFVAQYFILTDPAAGFFEEVRQLEASLIVQSALAHLLPHFGCFVLIKVNLVEL